MSHDVAFDLLVISRHAAPPAPAEVTRALAASGLGVANYTPATTPATPSAEKVERMRVGTHVVTLPGGCGGVRIVTWQYIQAVTEGMGDATFAALTRAADADTIHVLRTGTVSCNLRVSAREDAVVEALTWAQAAVGALLELTRGVVLDLGAQRCYGQAEAERMATDDPLVHIAFHDEPWEVETRWLHTHGLQKFGRPELEVVSAPVVLVAEAMALLRDVALTLTAGERIAAGDEIELDDAGKMLAAPAQADADHQAPLGRLRLVDAPLPGERSRQSVVRVLRRTALAEARRRLEADDRAGALDAIDRVLTDDPDDASALAMKARIALRLGEPIEALELGEFMRLRTPDDYRGPLTMGMALATLGRYREALHALDEAIEIEPEAADAFAERADVHERLGHEQLASVDRAHASYLAG